MTLKTIVQSTCKLLFAATFFSSTLYGANSEENVQDELVEAKAFAKVETENKLVRAIVGERALSKEEMESFEAERAIKAVDAEPLEEEHVSKPLYQTSHPGVFHSIFKLSFSKGRIELEDRSEWQIEWEYNYRNWRRNDVIMISPSGVPLYPYTLTNRRTNEYVLANLRLGPDLSSIYRIAINAIYMENGYVNIKLSDDSRWLMSSLDYILLTGWSIGDTVIIGINTDVYNSQGNNILINVSTNNRASGSCVAY